MYEHPVEQEIESIVIGDLGEGMEEHRVGRGGVTRIEACTKPGMMADIPYVRVWAGTKAIAEFCQHNIVGVFFGEDPRA